MAALYAYCRCGVDPPAIPQTTTEVAPGANAGLLPVIFCITEVLKMGKRRKQICRLPPT